MFTDSKEEVGAMLMPRPLDSPITGRASNEIARYCL